MKKYGKRRYGPPYRKQKQKCTVCKGWLCMYNLGEDCWSHNVNRETYDSMKKEMLGRLMRL